MKKLIIVLSSLVSITYATPLQYKTSYKTSDLETWLATSIICSKGISKDKCSENKQNLSKELNFDSAQVSSKNPLQIKQIKAYALNYTTSGVKGEKRTVSGGVLIPDIAQNKIKGIVLFYHPTEVSKYNVPSCFYNAPNLPKYCNTNTTQLGSNYPMELGSVFASQGYIVVMPDYIGQGIDNSVMHPYVAFPKSNAQSGLDMLASTRSLLNNLNYSKAKLKLYLSGFSEGGAYALWASKLLQTTSADVLSKNNLSLGTTAPISGAYDLSDSQVALEFTNIPVYPNNDKYNVFSVEEMLPAKLVVSSYMLNTIAYYAMNESYNMVFREPFKSMSCAESCLIDNHQYTIPQLYTQSISSFSTSGISSAIIHAALSSTNPLNNKKYSANNNSIEAFSQLSITQNPKFKDIVKAADIFKWKTKAPVSLIYLDYDSVVTNLNSIKAYEEMSKLSGQTMVQKRPISNFKYEIYFANHSGPIDHSSSRMFLYIAALKEMNAAP